VLSAFAAVALVAAPVAAGLWLLARARLWPPQRWRAVPWNGPLCALAALVFFIVPDFAAGSLDPQALQGWFLGGTAEPPAAKMLVRLAAGIIALPYQCVIWWAMYRLLTGARLVHLGATTHRWRQDTVLGVAAWFVISPAVYLVNFVVVVVYGGLYGAQPPNHPLLDLLKDHGDQFAVAALIITESVVAAPVREELFFRGILLPWLCRHPHGGSLGLAWAALAGLMARSRFLQDLSWANLPSLAAPVALIVFLAPVLVWAESIVSRRNPPPTLFALLPLADPERRRRAVAGLLGSAALFANIHAAVWPTPISLLVLGLGLGWLALRTQSVVGPIVCHALFNAVACSAMFLQR
jgi:membrane protease YdiL (CAAX protease family)